MPTQPSVFHPIRSNDVQQRPFYAYKNFRIISDNHASHSSSGYRFHSAIWKQHPPHIGVTTLFYPSNSMDKTNKHVVWNHIDAKYYRYPYDAGNTFGGSDARRIQKRLFYSASVLTVPYHDVGEKIKAYSVTGSYQIGHEIYRYEDDGAGNIRDPLIDSSSFATSSFSIIHMSFNDEYRNFETADDDPGKGEHRLGVWYGDIDYTFRRNLIKKATVNGVEIEKGVNTTGDHSYSTRKSGLAGKFSTAGGSYIRLPHDPMFDSFGKCDDWTISFWIKKADGDASSRPIISKGGLIEEEYFDTLTSFDRVQTKVANHIVPKKARGHNGPEMVDKLYYQRKSTRQKRYRDRVIPMPDVTASYAKVRTPFMIGVVTTGSAATGQFSSSYHFQSSDGDDSLHISSSVQPNVDIYGTYWDHVCIRNQSTGCEIYVNGTGTQNNGNTSGSLPSLPTANQSDIMIGAFPSASSSGRGKITDTFNSSLRGESLAELRMYEYAIDNNAINSLANRDFKSGSLYQTNVIGNVFYKQGQIVMSSPLGKFHSSSGVFETRNPGVDWGVAYKGTHKIYENNVLVRVPKDICNVSMNPTSTYKPPSGKTKGVCPDNKHQQNVLPGEFRKNMFVSGTAFPYVTTVGLYDDNCTLLAIGKLSTAVQKRDDIDNFFTVRWDY